MTLLKEAWRTREIDAEMTLDELHNQGDCFEQIDAETWRVFQEDVRDMGCVSGGRHAYWECTTECGEE